MALSPACRWISVSITSGGASVKAPAPLIGGSWPGSPSTRIGLPKASRSAAISRSDHRDLVEHDELGLAHQRLLVEDKARLVNIAEPKLKALEPLHRKQLLRRRQSADAGTEISGLLLDPRDFLRRCLGDPIDQTVNGRCRRALAGHHQRGLAGEGGEQHAAGGTAVAGHMAQARALRWHAVRIVLFPDPA